MGKGSVYFITGGAGFIGGAFVELLLKRGRKDKVICLDKMTYAASPERVRQHRMSSRFQFFKGDINDKDLVLEILRTHRPDVIVNFAAESHVDNSLKDVSPFVSSNIHGVECLLAAASEVGIQRFVQVSTDEVYGERLGDELFHERSPFCPRNPYAETKAKAEMTVFNRAKSLGLRYLITRGCNTYGPWQHAEKLIPKAITQGLRKKGIPIYGTGNQKREWIHVNDHAGAILHLIENDCFDDVYNIGTGDELENIKMVRTLLRGIGEDDSLLMHVEDRVNHDRRYGVDFNKLKQTGWQPVVGMSEGLLQTIDHYRCQERQSKSYMEVIREQNA